MAGSDIRAGRAYVELGVKNNLAAGMTKALQGAKAQLQAFGASMTAMGSSLFKVGATAAGAFGGMAAAFAFPIQAAGNLMETTSKFESVFGSQSAAMNEWAQNWANNVGRAKSDAMAGLSTFQSFFLGMGSGGEEAAKMSQKMQSLAVDFASFHNLQDSDAQQRFISALSGSGEVLSMYGVNIMQAALDQELLAMGFKKSTAGATEQQKVLARMSIISKTMDKQSATGDATKTAGSFSNQLKALKGAALTAAEGIGGALLPVITPLVTKAAAVVKMFAEWVAKNQGLVASIAKVAVIGTAVGVAIAGIGAGLVAAGAVVSAIGTVLGGIATVVTSAVTVIGTVGSAIAGVVAFVAPLILPVLGVAAAVAVVGGALVAATMAWVKYTDSGKAAMAGVVEAAGTFAGQVRAAFDAVVATVMPFVDVFQKAIGGIRDAFAAGDLGLAAQIAMTSIKLAFEMGKAVIVGIWFDLRDRLLGVWDSVVVEASAALVFITSLWSQVTTAIMESDFGYFLKSVWEGFKIAAQGAFDFILQQASLLLRALELIRGIVTATIKEVAIAVPAVAQATAGVTGTKAAKMANDFGGMVGKAGDAAQATREQVNDQRNELREKREAGNDAWQAAQAEKIQALEQERDRLAAQAAKQRKEVEEKREADKNKSLIVGAPGPKKPADPEKPKTVETKSLGDTFSAAAAVAMGRGGAGTKDAMAEKQAKDLETMKDAVGKLPDLLKTLNDGIADVVRNTQKFYARMK